MFIHFLVPKSEEHMVYWALHEYSIYVNIYFKMDYFYA